MTTLNSRLQLAMLNRKKGRNLLEKGFTLVELMIVIVIVGILSSVALPNFLSQQDKAKATEGTTTLSSILKTAYADYQADNSATDASTAATVAIAGANKVNFDYAHSPVTTGDTIRVLATGKAGLEDKGNLGGCVKLTTGEIKISKSLDTALTEAKISCPETQNGG
ncbi:type IV pilin protein [Synechococcus sp. A15-60]|uniref:type IV pilin protein n=1 Tax=Synechococcus sp. A15-60 TaxID=1050655 RepID=UPI0016453C2F|nr:prepilin-type N-terminal cleavage/methylation domain-containing protein [Synechococcus sp. A15-60]QNI49232.1 type IV pilin PilA [Synechococcus sp. A15-60]